MPARLICNNSAPSAKINIRVLAPLLILSGCLAYYFSITWNKEQLKPALANHGIFYDSTTPYIVHETKQTIKDSEIHSIEAVADGAHLRIKVIKPASIEFKDKYIQKKMYELKTLMAHNPSPYPGLISQQSSCDMTQPIQPTQFTNAASEGEWHRLHANSRLNPVCVQSDAKFHTLAFLLYCRQAQVFADFELFVPITDKVPDLARLPASCLTQSND